MMRIKDVLEAPLRSPCDVSGLVQKKQKGTTKAKQPYLTVRIADSDASIEFPIWTDVEERDEKIHVGDVIRVMGGVGEYNGVRQIDVSGMMTLKPTPEEMERYIAKYEITEHMMEYFKSTLWDLSSPYKEFAYVATGHIPKDMREGLSEGVLKVLDDRWSDFTSCVAASKHHQNKQAGLFIHTLGVTRILDVIMNIYMWGRSQEYYDSMLTADISAAPIINHDRLILKGVVHDICKPNEYEFRKGIYRKDVLVDHRIMFIHFSLEINDELKKMGWPSLSDDELRDIQQSVLAHHGPWGPYKPRNLEDTLLHLADVADAKIAGCAQSGDTTTGIDFSIQGMLSSMERI